MATTVVYEDRWGEVLDRGSLDLIELRWFDTTSAMSADEFKESLKTFAGCVELSKRSLVLIDGTNFRMDPANMNATWRDANIIPRYNAAGVRRFAFQMPEGMPLIGTPPAPEGPAHFPTGYFGRREHAMDWLSAS